MALGVQRGISASASILIAVDSWDHGLGRVMRPGLSQAALKELAWRVGFDRALN